MYLVVIAWMYVVLMMSAAEATSSNGSVLGAIVTLLLYGVGPVALVVYLMRAPARNKAIKQREAQVLTQQAGSALKPDVAEPPHHNAADTTPASAAPKSDSNA